MLAMACLFGQVGIGQTSNGFLDFGTTASGTAATTANTGFSGVRVGSGGGGFTIQNPGQSIGTAGELRGIAPTGGSVNSVGIASAQYGTAATTFTVSFEMHLSGGASGIWYFFAGNGGSFAAAQTTGFTGADVFTGLRWTFAASNAIVTNNRNGGSWNATGLTGTPFAQNTAYYVTIIGNNSASTVNYGASSAYSVASGTYDLWLNGTLVGDNLANGDISANTSINAFRFYGESSTANVATLALDNIRWYNTCVLPPTHLTLVGVPSSGVTGTNLSSYTAEAHSGSTSGPVANSFVGAITVSKASGPGTISGTLGPNAVAGVATYSNTQFSSAGAYTISAAAAAPVVNSAASGTITITDPPPVPTVSSFTPTSGFAGSSIVITGTNFTGVTAVQFGGTNAASFTVDNSTQITAVVGVGTTGTVSVTNANGTGTSAGTYTFNGYISAQPGDFNTGSTWQGGNVPGTGAAVTIAHDVTLPGNVTVGNLDLFAGSLSIGANTLTINGTVSRTSGNLAGGNTSNLIIGGTAGSLFFDGTGTNNYLSSLTINNGASATLGNALNITAFDGTSEGVLTVTGTGTLASAGFLTIKSNATGTARIAAGRTTGGYITGDVSVERFIPQNSSKSWRLLASNTIGQTLNEAWQEGAVGGMVNPNPGFGTMIPAGASITTSLGTAQAAGFDTLAPGVSLFKYNPATDVLDPVTATNTGDISSEQGYFIFIRGNRGPGQFGSGAPASSTVLRSKGTLFTGDQTAVATGAQNYALMRNPYPSRIDMREIVRGVNLVDAFQVWDAKLGGAFGVGGFQTFNKSDNDYIVTPGNGSYGPNGSVHNFIESGAAFYIQSVSNISGNTAQVVEAAKASASSNNSFRPLAGQGRIAFNLYANNAGNFDGVDGGLVFFDNAFSNAVDINDVRKSFNFNENFGIVRDNIQLVVEKRESANINDTIFFSMGQMRQLGYRLDIQATAIDPLLTTAVLEDRYTNTSTTLDLGMLNSYSFTVDANPASKAANRFRVVFRQSSVVPVTFVSIKAAQAGKNIVVDWNVANELNVTRYEVERSADGSNFDKKGAVTAMKLTAYSWIDENIANGYNYYRIKSVDNNGRVKYSQTAKVMIGGKAGIVVSPNPAVQGGSVNIRFTDQQAGKYGIKITNIAGQTVYNRQLLHNGGSSSQSFVLPSGLVKGLYQLEIVAPDNTRSTEKLVISQVN